jgi:hypothetical protein
MSQPSLLNTSSVGLHIKWRDVSTFGYILRGAIRLIDCPQIRPYDLPSPLRRPAISLGGFP